MYSSTPPRKLRHNLSLGLQILPSLSVFWGLFFTLTARIGYINEAFGETAGCGDCFTRNVIIFDAPFLFGLLSLYILSLANIHLVIRLGIRLIIVVGALLYIGDHIVSQNMYTRLQLADISTYGSQLTLIAEHIRNTDFLGLPLYAIAVVGTIIILAFLLFPLAALPKKVWLSGTLACATLGGIAVIAFSPTVYVHNWAMKNVISANLTPGVAQDYSTSYRNTLEPITTKACKPGTAHNDIILLILESWSPYQSKLWKGANNWTPKLDAIAQNNMYFSNFYAAGFSTNEGLASILTGLATYSPINPFFASSPFQGLWSNSQSTAPRYITSNGYQSVFLTTGDLSFSKKGEWLNNIGFDYVEGHDATFYDGLPRLHFRSVADEHLYARARQYMQKHRDPSKPLFLTLENVSTHQPFIHPHTRERNLQAVFEYMDATAADFYHTLESDGFFAEGGIFIAVSDHRSMTPISRQEQKQLGHLAASKIPAFVAYQGVTAKNIKTLGHQGDVLPSLKHYLSEGNCPISNHLNMITGESHGKSRCVFHARGDQRDHIDVICPNGSGTIKLAGDDSEFIDNNHLTQQQREASLAELAHIRLDLQKNHQQWSDSISD